MVDVLYDDATSVHILTDKLGCSPSINSGLLMLKCAFKGAAVPLRKTLVLPISNGFDASALDALGVLGTTGTCTVSYVMKFDAIVNSMLTAVPITFGCAGSDAIVDDGASALLDNILISAVVAGKLGEDSIPNVHAMVKYPITSLSLTVVAEDNA